MKLIPSRLIVWALALREAPYHCKDCNARMFVRTPSELCPVCWNALMAAAEPGEIEHR